MQRAVFRFFSRSTLLIGLVVGASPPGGALGDTLDAIRARGELVWGADIEGGGPYIYVDPSDSNKAAGFEVDLANALRA